MCGERETKLPRWLPSWSPLALHDSPVSFWFKLLMSQSQGLTECLAVSSAHPNTFMWLLYRLSGETEAISLFFTLRKFMKWFHICFSFKLEALQILKYNPGRICFVREECGITEGK